MAAKESPRISLLMATGHNYRLFPGVKADLSTGSVGSSGHVVFAIRSFFFSHSLNRLLALPLSFPLSLIFFFHRKRALIATLGCAPAAALILGIIT